MSPNNPAPKHMAMPLGWQNYFCFVCSPRHATHRQHRRTTCEITVSFPTSQQILHASMAAAMRDPDGSKPSLAALESVPSRPGTAGVLVSRFPTFPLECACERVIDGFGENSLIVGPDRRRGGR